MADLINKLTAALDETERIALAAIEGGRCDYPDLHDHANWHAPSRGDVASCGTILVFADYPDERVVDHIVHNDPAHVLRQVAAHRKILELHSGSHECTSAEDNCVWIDGISGAICETVKIAAEAYGIEVE